jgi:hypothetical protein
MLKSIKEILEVSASFFERSSPKKDRNKFKKVKAYQGNSLDLHGGGENYS